MISGNEGLSAFESVLSCFHVYPYYKYLSETAFYVIYFFAVLIIFITYFLITISYYNHNAKNTNTCLTIVLSQIIFSLSNYAFIPIFGTLLIIFNCENNSLYYNSDVVCWSIPHYIAFLIGLVILILSLPLFVISSLIYFDTIETDSSYISREATNILTLELISKAALETIFVLVPNSNFKIWVLICLTMVIYIKILHHAYVISIIFYSNIINMVFLYYHRLGKFLLPSLYGMQFPLFFINSLTVKIIKGLLSYFSKSQF